MKKVLIPSGLLSPGYLVLHITAGTSRKRGETSQGMLGSVGMATFTRWIFSWEPLAGWRRPSSKPEHKAQGSLGLNRAVIHTGQYKNMPHEGSGRHWVYPKFKGSLFPKAFGMPYEWVFSFKTLLFLKFSFQVHPSRSRKDFSNPESYSLLWRKMETLNHGLETPTCRIINKEDNQGPGDALPSSLLHVDHLIRVPWVHSTAPNKETDPNTEWCDVTLASGHLLIVTERVFSRSIPFQNLFYICP